MSSAPVYHPHRSFPLWTAHLYLSFPLWTAHLYLSFPLRTAHSHRSFPLWIWTAQSLHINVLSLISATQPSCFSLLLPDTEMLQGELNGGQTIRFFETLMLQLIQCFTLDMSSRNWAKQIPQTLQIHDFTEQKFHFPGFPVYIHIKALKMMLPHYWGL